jgi:K+-sensing histidine kinase KdpD
VNGTEVAGLVRRYKVSVTVVSGLVPLLVCAVLALFRDDLTAASAVLILVLAVVAAASTGLRTAGLAAALSAGLWFDVFLTQPYGRLTIDDANDVEATVLLVLIGAAVSEVAQWGYRQQAKADRRAGYLDGVLTTAEIVMLPTTPPDEVIGNIASQIKQVLGADECRFVAGPVHDSRIAILGHDGQVSRGDQRINVETNGLPTDNEIALLVAHGSQTLGHFRLTASTHITRPSLEQRKVAALFADQAGSALTRPGG